MITVCALYKFTPLADYAALRSPLLELMSEKGIKGTLLLAHEGINGTVAGPAEAIEQLLAFLRSDERQIELAQARGEQHIGVPHRA